MSSKHEEEGLQQVARNKTNEFLWKAGEALKTDVELSREFTFTLVDSMADSVNVDKICPKCGVMRDPSNFMYRIKPKQKFSKSYQRAMKVHSKTRTNSSAKLAKRFINSRSTLLIHCKICSHMEKIPAASRADICEIKTAMTRHGNRSRTPASTPTTSRTSTPASKRGSIESFINRSINKTPNSTPRNKKKRSSHLSQLLANEVTDSPTSSLMDFLTSLKQ